MGTKMKTKPTTNTMMMTTKMIEKEGRKDMRKTTMKKATKMKMKAATMMIMMTTKMIEKEGRKDMRKTTMKKATMIKMMKTTAMIMLKTRRRTTTKTMMIIQAGITVEEEKEDKLKENK